MAISLTWVEKSLVGEAEAEVLDDRAAAVLERLGEVLRVAGEVDVVGAS